MSTTRGQDGLVKIGANTVAEVKSWTLDRSMNVTNDSELSDEWETGLPGKKSASGSVECHWDVTDTNGQEAIETAYENETVVALDLYPQGAVSGDLYYVVSGYITSIGVSVSDGETVSRSFAFKANGAVTTATVV